MVYRLGDHKVFASVSTHTMFTTQVEQPVMQSLNSSRYISCAAGPLTVPPRRPIALSIRYLSGPTRISGGAIPKAVLPRVSARCRQGCHENKMPAVSAGHTTTAAWHKSNDCKMPGAMPGPRGPKLIR